MNAEVHSQSVPDGHSKGPDASTAIDPVCGMTVTIKPTSHRTEHDGEAYYFCGLKCRDKFVAEPMKYLMPQPLAVVAAVEGVQWTCPMHPEILRDHPGSCPICGMALEPLTPSSTAGANPELADMTIRFWIGLALSVPVFALEMGNHL